MRNFDFVISILIHVQQMNSNFVYKFCMSSNQNQRCVLCCFRIHNNSPYEYSVSMLFVMYFFFLLIKCTLVVPILSNVHLILLSNVANWPCFKLPFWFVSSLIDGNISKYHQFWNGYLPVILIMQLLSLRIRTEDC